MPTDTSECSADERDASEAVAIAQLEPWVQQVGSVGCCRRADRALVLLPDCSYSAVTEANVDAFAERTAELAEGTCRWSTCDVLSTSLSCQDGVCVAEDSPDTASQCE